MRGVLGGVGAAACQYYDSIVVTLMVPCFVASLLHCTVGCVVAESTIIYRLSKCPNHYIYIRKSNLKSDTSHPV